MKLTFRRPALAAALATAVLAAHAQQASPVLPRPVPAPEPATPAQPLELSTPARPALPSNDGLAVRVERFKVSGNTRLPPEALAAVLAPFEQRTLDYADLAAAADAVTALYRQSGWLLALAYLPEQQIRDGEVEIAVLEGRLGSLAVDSAPAGASRSFASAVASWNLSGGEVVGEANLVRNLLVLNEWAGIGVGAEVRPGRDVGTADVVVELREAAPRWSGTLSADNLGARATGRVRVGATATARSLAGRGDLLSVQGLYGTEGGLRSLAASYGAMVHSSGTRLTFSASRLDYELVDPAFAALDAQGDATALQLSFDQPLLRRVGEALTLRVGLGGKRLRDRVQAFAQKEDRHLESVQLALYGEHGARGPVSTRWSASATNGRVGFDDPVAEAADRQLRQTAGRYNRLNLDLAHERALSERFSLVGRAAWQHAIQTNLDVAERAVIGGAGALRAYGELPAQADSAVQGSLELRWRLPLALPSTASVFYDRGVGRVDHLPTSGADNGVRSKLLGAGLETLLPADLTLRLAASRQNTEPAPPGGPAWANRGWLELVKGF